MKTKIIVLTIPVILLGSWPARADIFGGDDAILAQILVQAVQTVTALQSILQNGSDTLKLLNEINDGSKTGLAAIQILAPQLSAGVYGNLKDPSAALQAVEQVYGQVPQGMDHDLIQSQDQSVAEVISMNRNLYDYADQVDHEKDQILFHAQAVSPLGAGRLENQALGVLIGVSTELLRTQSQMLKLMAENMALQTRHQAISSENMHDNYQGLARDFQSLPTDTKLPELNSGSGGAP